MSQSLPLQRLKEEIAREARRGAPVDTGALRDSIRVTEDGVEVGVPYAADVEFDQTPFLRPAIQRVKRKYTE